MQAVISQWLHSSQPDSVFHSVDFFDDSIQFFFFFSFSLLSPLQFHSFGGSHYFFYWLFSLKASHFSPLQRCKLSCFSSHTARLISWTMKKMKNGLKSKERVWAKREKAETDWMKQKCTFAVMVVPRLSRKKNEQSAAILDYFLFFILFCISCQTSWAKFLSYLCCNFSVYLPTYLTNYCPVQEKGINTIFCYFYYFYCLNCRMCK